MIKIEEEANKKYCPECSDEIDKTELWGNAEDGWVCPWCGYEIEGNIIERKEVEVIEGVYL